MASSLALLCKCARPGDCELEGPYECPQCGRHSMFDATFLDQVALEVVCPYCNRLLAVPSEPSDDTSADLAPLVLSKIDIPGGQLMFREEQIIIPQRKNGNIFFIIPDLHLKSYGTTRDEAIADLLDDLVWMWREYAHAMNDSLSYDAMELATSLNNMLVFVPD